PPARGRDDRAPRRLPLPPARRGLETALEHVRRRHPGGRRGAQVARDPGGGAPRPARAQPRRARAGAAARHRRALPEPHRGSAGRRDAVRVHCAPDPGLPGAGRPRRGPPGDHLDAGDTAAPGARRARLLLEQRQPRGALHAAPERPRGPLRRALGPRRRLRRGEPALAEAAAALPSAAPAAPGEAGVRVVRAAYGRKPRAPSPRTGGAELARPTPGVKADTREGKEKGASAWDAPFVWSGTQ